MRPQRTTDHWKGSLALFLAQGFGTGRLKPGPGTWGSLVGLLWTWLLLASHSWVITLSAIGLSIAGAIPLSSWAAQHLGDKDPSSVVIDEIVALPLVFVLPLALYPALLGVPARLPDPMEMGWWFVGFALFRLFDILKPSPIRQSQALPGGWGIVVDDLLAALAASIVLGAIVFWRYR